MAVLPHAGTLSCVLIVAFGFRNHETKNAFASTLGDEGTGAGSST